MLNECELFCILKEVGFLFIGLNVIINEICKGRMVDSVFVEDIFDVFKCYVRDFMEVVC